VNRTYDTIHPAGLAIFLSVLLISFMYKRGFCSWICPIGAFSEGLWNIGKRLFGRNPRLPKYLDWLLMAPKYLILAFFLKVVFFDMSANSAAAFLNGSFNKIADAKMLEFWLHPSYATVEVTALLVLLSIPLKNFWCRYLCPYGALLGVVSLPSPIKVTRDRERCINCKACSRACPNQIEVAEKLRVDSIECTGCFDCIESCSPKALSLKVLNTDKAVSQKSYALLLLGTFFLIIFIAKATGHWNTSLGYEDYVRLIPNMGLFSH